MIKFNRREIHEVFHSSTKIQRKIIDKNNFTYKIIFTVLNKYINKNNKILDIGCGAGTICFYLASKGRNVLGIDISQNAIISCEESAKLLGLKNARFERMDFPNKIPKKKFDFIICSEVLEHLKNDELALKKIYSLLSNKGIAVISTPSKNAPMYRMGLAKEFDERVGHLRRYALEELINKCKKAGFEIIDTKKTEGVLRNFLFLNPIAGKLVRFIKFFLSDIVSFVDEISLWLFGESQIFIIVQKPL